MMLESCFFSVSSDLKDALKRANNTRYGLAAGVFTSNLDTVNTLVRAIKVGTVWVNCYQVLDAAIPLQHLTLHSSQGYSRSLPLHSSQGSSLALSLYMQLLTIISVGNNEQTW